MFAYICNVKTFSSFSNILKYDKEIQDRIIRNITF